MIEQQIEELVYQIWLATGAEDDATKPPIRQAIIQAINMTKDEDAEIAKLWSPEIASNHSPQAISAAILSTKIKET